MKNRKILVICGPTSSGKTSLALSVANEVLKSASGVNILSVDSRQIYKDLDILTGKDIPEDLPEDIHFFGLDLISPDKKYNLADFTLYAKDVIADSIKKDIPLIVVGGTGLFLKSITSNFLNVNVPPDVKLRKDLEKLTVEELKEKLLKIDIKKYNSLNNSDINNPRRLIRAIEIAEYSPSTTQGALRNKFKFTPEFFWIGLSVKKEDLINKIRERVLSRIHSGAIEEVQKLLDTYPDQKLPIYTSLGVGDILDFLSQKISKDQLIEIWTRHEIDYARRQMVWFKKQSGIVWYDKDSVNLDLTKLLADKIND